LPPLAWSSFCSRVLLLINSTSIIMSNCNFQNSWVLDDGKTREAPYAVQWKL
jgi:hypothetical protein